MKNNPKKSSQPQEPNGPIARSSGIKWYDEDHAVIMSAMQQGLLYGIRLNMAQVVRMLVRKADLKKLTIEDYQKAAVADDGRRRRKGKE